MSKERRKFDREFKLMTVELSKDRVGLADRKVVGWALSQTMKARDTTMAALKMAIIPTMPKGSFAHSGRELKASEKGAILLKGSTGT